MGWDGVGGADDGEDATDVEETADEDETADNDGITDDEGAKSDDKGLLGVDEEATDDDMREGRQRESVATPATQTSSNKTPKIFIVAHSRQTKDNQRVKR